jgi:hypothetical protein
MKLVVPVCAASAEGVANIFLVALRIGDMMKTLRMAARFGLSASVMAACISAQAFEVDRTHLPIAEPDPPKFKELDVRNV